MDLHPGEDGRIGVPPMIDVDDFECVFESVYSRMPTNEMVIFQAKHQIQRSDCLRYTTVTAAGVSLKAMINSGSTGCTFSEPPVEHLQQHNPDMRRCR